MRSIDHPSFLTADQRLSEVAAILAIGVLRLHARTASSSDELSSEESPDSERAGLEVSSETVLSVHGG